MLVIIVTYPQYWKLSLINAEPAPTKYVKSNIGRIPEMNSTMKSISLRDFSFKQEPWRDIDSFL